MRSLAMSSSRRAAFARAAADRFDVDESTLQPVIERAMRAYIAKCRDSFRAHVASSHLTAAAVPAKSTAKAPAKAPKFTNDMAGQWLDWLDSSEDWGPILDTAVMPAVTSLVDNVLAPAMKDKSLTKSLVDWRNGWLTDRRQELVGIPDQVTSQFRTALTAAASKRGTDVEDARIIAQQMLDDDYPSWSGRAQLIARTETVGANNQGALASWSTLAETAQITATKSWLATDDDKTRPDHAEMDGQTVDITDNFDMPDGTQMNGPGDPAGGAGQVCNCRCTMTYDFPQGTESQASDDDNESGDDDSGGSDELDTGGTRDFPTVSSALTAAAADTAPSTGVAIMLTLDAASAAACAAPGVDVEPPGLHCTVAYLSEPAASYTPEQQQSLVSALGSVTPQGSAVAFATAQFNPNDPEREPCAVLLVQSEWLAGVHAAVLAAMDEAGVEASTSFPIWIPHVAIGYNVDTSVIPPTAAGSDVGFDGLILGWADDQIPIGQSDPTGQTDPEQALTAAVEAPVTAPAVDAPPTAPATPDDSATGGDTGAPVQPGAVTWSGPLASLSQAGGALIPSSDGRAITSGGGTIRPLPLPLSWQKESSYDHEGSIIVGRILTVEDRGDVLWGTGDWLDPWMNMDAQQAMAQVDAGLGLISIDMGAAAVDLFNPDGSPLDPALYNGDGEDLIANYVTWEFCGATLVSVPAFADVRIANDQPATDNQEEIIMGSPIAVGGDSFAAASPEAPTVSADGTSVTLSDGTVVSVGDSVGYDDGTGGQLVGTLTALDVTANTATVQPSAADDGTTGDPMTVDVGKLSPAAPVSPAKDATDGGDASLTASSMVTPYRSKSFEKRQLDGPTPFTITDDGQVFGHMATFGECHLGKMMEGVCQTAPHSDNDYGFFHLAPVMTDAGPVDIGKITIGTGHAGPLGNFRGALSHYDNTGTQVAVIRAYDDDFGIQVAGEIIHGTPPEKIEELRRSPLSGDWRATRHNGPLELVAALAINTPGFAVRRQAPRVGLGGHGLGQISLVAAGILYPDEEVQLPSGAKIGKRDFESLVAASRAAMAPATVEGIDELAQRREVAELKMRLEFAGRRGLA